MVFFLIYNNHKRVVMMNKDRIKKMEENLDLTNDLIKELKNDLKKFKSNKKKIYELSKYYGSNDWYTDCENFDNSIKAGVLSEDLPYDALIELHSLAIDLISLGTDILKNE